MIQWMPMHLTPGLKKTSFPSKNITNLNFHFLAFFVVFLHVFSPCNILFLYKMELYILYFSATCFFQQIFTFMSFIHIVYSCSLWNCIPLYDFTVLRSFYWWWTTRLFADFLFVIYNSANKKLVYVSWCPFTRVSWVCV